MCFLLLQSHQQCGYTEISGHSEGLAHFILQEELSPRWNVLVLQKGDRDRGSLCRSAVAQIRSNFQLLLISLLWKAASRLEPSTANLIRGGGIKAIIRLHVTKMRIYHLEHEKVATRDKNESDSRIKQMKTHKFWILAIICMYFLFLASPGLIWVYKLIK